MVHFDLQVVAPLTGVGGFHLKALRTGPLRFSAAAVGYDKPPNDDSLATTVSIEVSHGIGHRVIDVQPTKKALEVAEVVDGNRLVYFPPSGPADKGCDRSGDAGDRPHAA